MLKSANVTGSEPAASIVVPSRRADSVTVTGRVIPFSVKVAGAVRVIVSPEENAAGSATALGLGAIATAFLESDPDFAWDAVRAAALRDVLAAPGLGPEPPGEAGPRSPRGGQEGR